MRNAKVSGRCWSKIKTSKRDIWGRVSLSSSMTFLGHHRWARISRPQHLNGASNDATASPFSQMPGYPCEFEFIRATQPHFFVVSEPVSEKISTGESTGIGIKNIFSRKKKYRYWYRLAFWIPSHTGSSGSVLHTLAHCCIIFSVS